MIRSIIAAAALSVAAMPALAASTDFDMMLDIDRAALETPAGAEGEFQKVLRDVHKQCIVEQTGSRLPNSRATAFCENRTMKSAVKAIDAPNFTAAYEAWKAR